MLKQQALTELRTLKSYITQSKNATYTGNVDGVNGTLLYGWVLRQKSKWPVGLAPPLRVGLFTQGSMLLSANASGQRLDVLASGHNSAECGFEFDITPGLHQAISEQGGEVTVRVLDERAFLIGRWRFPAAENTQTDPAPEDQKAPQTRQEHCLLALGSNLEKLEHLLDSSVNAATIAPTITQPLASNDVPLVHEKLFTPVTEPSDSQTPALPVYLDFTRYRFQQDQNFNLKSNAADFDHYLSWYLEAYSPQRGELRAPLSRELIDYLNQDIVIGGKPHVASRIMWWRMARNMGAWVALDLSSLDSYRRLCYWWAWEEARALYVEDCLISPHVIKTLSEEDPERAGEAWTLTPFIHWFVQSNVKFQFVDGEIEGDRRLLILSLLVVAISRPDVLRYLPAGVIDAAFTPEEDATTLFGAFIADLTGKPELATLSQARYQAALRLAGFDLATGQFLSRDANGNRYGAAALPAVIGETKVDVQLIGPIEKASGLGQATRLSAKALDLTGLSLNKVDFGLDNPALEGFSSVEEHGGYKPARINLIHLNAESVPLAFAYEPDVFNGAYNIGYFFWELDSPAACHYLALDLLDEVWVSSQYGVDIYRPATDKPVNKVGMCYEPVPDIDPIEARAFVSERCGFGTDSFTFLVAFDSFSFIQRKNPIGVLEAFSHAFSKGEDVHLIIKTQNRDRMVYPTQIAIWKEVDEIVAKDARIIILNETLSYSDFLKLKKGSDCYVSLHKSEGWGFGMIEAMNLKVPVVCTGYSGNMEFCTPETAWLVDYHEVELEPDDYIFVVPGQKWAEPDIADAARQMRAVYANPKARRKKVKAAYDYVSQNFSPEAIGVQYKRRLKQILAGLRKE